MKLTEEGLKKLYLRNTRYKHPIVSTLLTITLWLSMIIISFGVIGDWRGCFVVAAVILWTILGVIFANNVICFLYVKEWRKGVAVLLLSGPREIVWAISEILYPIIVDAIKHKLDNIFTGWKENEDE